MKKYGKIVCGTLKVPQIYPGYIVLNGKKVYKPTEKQYKTSGYLPVVESEPEQREGYEAVASYKEEGGKIVQVWNYSEIVETETRNAE